MLLLPITGACTTTNQIMMGISSIPLAFIHWLSILHHASYSPLHNQSVVRALSCYNIYSKPIVPGKKDVTSFIDGMRKTDTIHVCSL